MENNLKNKMNGIPQDFDTEALWKRIEGPKKKNRGFLLMFLLGIGTFIIGAGIFFLTNNEFSEKQEFIVSEQIINKESTISITENIAVDTLENKKREGLIAEKKEVSQKEKKDKKQESISLAEAVQTRTLRKTFEILNQSIPGNSVENKTENLVYQNVSDEKNHEPKEEWKLIFDESIVREQVVKNDKTRTAIIELAMLERLGVKEFELFTDKFQRTGALSIKKYHHNKNTLNLLVGLGNDSHGFSDSSLGRFREMIEKSLVTTVIRLSVERSIGKRFFIEPSLMFARSQSNINFSDRKEYWNFVTAQELVRTWTETKYNIYNQYYRLDLGIAMGYEIPINKQLSLKPSIGVGYNLKSFQRGDYWNVDLEKSSLKEEPSYDLHTNFFGFGSFKLEYKMNQHYRIGVRLEQQLTRSLTKDQYHDHQITPFSTGIYVGRNF